MSGIGNTVTMRKTWEGLRERADSFLNELTGIGTARDKRMGARVAATWFLLEAELEGLHTNNDVAATIVDAVVDDALREPYDLVVDGDEDKARAAALMDAGNALEVREKIIEAWKWGRLYGGAAILLGADDGRDMSLPLAVAQVRAVHYLEVLTRWELSPHLYDEDPLSPEYGRVSVYRMHALHDSAQGRQRTALVHRSRLVFFEGAHAPPRVRQRNHGWSASVLQRPYEVLSDFGMSFASAAHLLQDNAQAVFKMRGLHDMITAGDKDTMRARMELVDINRSVARMMVIDAEDEDFERKTTPLTGTPELLDRMVQRLAAAAQMPVTRLMGISPAGLNATGESDARNWHDRVQSAQTHVLRARLVRLYRLLAAAKQGPFGGRELGAVDVRFRPLWKPTARERVEMRKMTAETDAIYVDKQVVWPEEVAVGRMGPEGWESDMQVDIALRQEVLDADLRMRVTEPIEPEPDPAPTDPTPQDVPVTKDVQKQALNGAQVQSLQAIVTAVANGEIPRESGVAMIEVAFPLSREQAERVMGSVGQGFVPAKPAASALPFDADAEPGDDDDDVSNDDDADDADDVAE